MVAHALSSIMRQILTNAGFSAFEKMTEIRNKSENMELTSIRERLKICLKPALLILPGLRLMP